MKVFFTLVLPSSSSQIESGLILLGCPTRKRLQLASTGRLCILRGKCCHYMHSWRGRSKWGSYSGPKADASEVPGSQEVNVHPSVSVATIPLLARTTQNITFYIFHFLALFFRVLERRKRDGLVLTNHFFFLIKCHSQQQNAWSIPSQKRATTFPWCFSPQTMLSRAWDFKSHFPLEETIQSNTSHFAPYNQICWFTVRLG